MVVPPWFLYFHPGVNFASYKVEPCKIHTEYESSRINRNKISYTFSPFYYFLCTTQAQKFLSLSTGVARLLYLAEPLTQLIKGLSHQLTVDFETRFVETFIKICELK